VGDVGTVLGVVGMFWSLNLFVVIDSYAIASLHASGWEVTRWGLFLMREVHFLFQIHSLWESRAVAEGLGTHSRSSVMEDPSQLKVTDSEALSTELD
jgi:hypothetical protein